MIPQETIDKVFAVARIEEVVSDYVSLKRRGANLIGLCPFHNEKTGSFTVSPSKGIFKCFGCGKSGHAVGFVMEIEQCGFADAVKQIAKKYHIEIEEREMTPEEQQRQDDRESMFVVNDFANKWFQDQLWNTDEGKAIGMSYFLQRGLREDTIRKFQLGYSPERGNPLAKALKEKGFIEKYLVNDVDTKIGTGVVGKSEDGRLYDRFRDRVIFPIHSVSGKTVGFAGRILRKKDNVGKYVNSPDSIIYSKTNELYGLFLAKQAIAKADLCYLVEGQMDLISMYQAGIENVVASGGTALTRPQIRLIRRFTSNITILYDGDAAGVHAALRGIDMFLEEGFNVQVVLLPDGEDPDSFANSHDASEFIAYIKEHQTDFIRFKLNLLSQDAGNDQQKRIEVVKEITTSISKISDSITSGNYIQSCASQLHIDERDLRKKVSGLRRIKIEEDKKRGNITDNPTTIKVDNEDAEKNNTEENSSTENAKIAELFHDIHFLDKVTPTKLDENFLNLLQLIVRYGERPLYQLSDGSFVSVGAYIIKQLEDDCIAPPEGLYRKLLEEFTEHCHDEGFVAENFFKFHPDVNMSALAVDLIADKYQLSSIYSRQSISDNVVQKVEVSTDADHLTELVPQLLLELKYTIVNMRLEKLKEMIKEAEQTDNWQLLRELLSGQPALLEIKNEISKQLGNRIITL